MALNPIRDTVFLGNETAYDTWGMINTGISLALCAPIASTQMITGEGIKQAITNFLGSGASNIAKQTISFGGKSLLVAGSGMAVEAVVTPYTSEDAGRLMGLLTGEYVGIKVFGVKTVESKRFNLTQEKIDEILAIQKGKRPDPSTYLSKDYIDNHLAQFKDGASIIMTKEQYITYVKGSEYIGIPSDGTQFVMPKNYCDDIASISNGNINVYEMAQGFDIGHFEDGGGLVRIDIDNLEGLNLRMPSGNEAGANNHWIPGGKTDGDVSEAILDLIPNTPSNIKITELK